MYIEKDPIFQGVATAVIVAFLGLVSVKIKRQYRKILRGLKKVWKMARGNGISLEEHNDAIADLKEYFTELVTLRTYPIQPDSNGGSSLPDLNQTMKNLRKDIQHGFDEVRKQNIETHGVASEAVGAINAHIQSSHKEKP